MSNDIERRTLLGAAGIGALAALAHGAKPGGPLNPPAGSIAPSGHTLDEVYAKVAAPDGVTALPPEILTITAPGYYRLTGPRSGAGAMLLIAASNVTVDLNGHTLTSTSTSSGVVEVSGVQTNITVRNGTLASGNYGFACFTASSNVVLEDLTLLGQRLIGVAFGHNSFRTARIVNCHAVNIGAATVPGDSGLQLRGFVVTGSFIYMYRCTVLRFLYNGSGTADIRGIDIASEPVNGGFANTVDSCVVAHSANFTGPNSIGIRIASAGQYRNNASMGFPAAYSINTTAVLNGGGNV
ncbi:MAG: hypothetical protein ACREJO_16605 [Phycisphaerales bacterium]